MSAPPSFPPEQNYGPIPNYMVWAILITIAAFCLCCVVGAVPGVVAIVFASQVNSKLAAGDRAGAEQSSKNAKLWCWITTGLAIFGLLLTILLKVTGYSERYMQDYMEAMQEVQQTQQE
ncbi:MAG TPA: CD225/dispanin family protein [Lysobacter sp.]|nr:CD225/dispanin family protein [Lysobacter sp.]